MKGFFAKLKDFYPKLKVSEILLFLKPQNRWKKGVGSHESRNTRGLRLSREGKRRTKRVFVIICVIFSGLLTREELTTCVASSVGCVERPWLKSFSTSGGSTWHTFYLVSRTPTPFQNDDSLFSKQSFKSNVTKRYTFKVWIIWCNKNMGFWNSLWLSARSYLDKFLRAPSGPGNANPENPFFCDIDT